MEGEKEPTEKEIQEIKSILEKQHGREFTWEEARQAMWDLQMFARIAYEAASEELRREKLLKEQPKGFHLDKSGTCKICGNITSNENSWYDKYGLKCMPCQNAVNAKIIPGSVAKRKMVGIQNMSWKCFSILKALT